jgi:hypothetical protein
MNAVIILTMFVNVAALFDIKGTTSMSLIQSAQPFSHVQSCHHFYHTFHSCKFHCDKGQQ